MPDSPEDIELSRLKRAEEFLRVVRLTQAASNKAQTGGNFLSPEQEQAITSATESSGLVAAIKRSANVDLPVNHLAERFEEMCRRQGVMVDADLRPSLVKLLTTELFVNHTALCVPAAKMVSATLHQGALAPDLLAEFPALPPYAIAHAMIYAPATSREFLRRAAKEIETLSSEPEFQPLADRRPREFIQAALHFPTNVRERLRRISKGAGDWTQRQTEDDISNPPRR